MFEVQWPQRSLQFREKLESFWKNSPVYNLNVRKRSLALEEERVGAVGEELAAKAARLDTRESELREANLDIQKKLDDT